MISSVVVVVVVSLLVWLEHEVQPTHVPQLHLLSHGSSLLSQNALQGRNVGVGVGAGVGGSRQNSVLPGDSVLL
jgi:hypothetical protein